MPYSRSHAGTIVVTWNTGETSTVAITTFAEDVAGQTVHTLRGTVIAGLFTGAGFVEAIAQTNLHPLPCVFPPGITGHTGTGAVLFV